MLDKIKSFREQATALGRDGNSVDELKLFIEAEEFVKSCADDKVYAQLIEKEGDAVPSSIRAVDNVYVQFRGIKNDLTKIFHDLKGEDSVDISSVLDQLNKAMEGLETLLQRYA